MAHRNGEEPPHDDEIAILNGVLELNTKNVEAIMTPLKVVILSRRSFSVWSQRLNRIQWFLAQILFWTTKLSMPCVSSSLLRYQNWFVIMFHSLLSGYSCFPVHEAGNPLTFVGLLLIKKVGPCDDTGSLF